MPTERLKKTADFEISYIFVLRMFRVFFSNFPRDSRVRCTRAF
ncbi:conserved hypothetical protein [delta proteobacterium NaphS2]|nr:conserved hypothetical protein [delta proteobacterium NaphS2]